MWKVYKKMKMHSLIYFGCFNFRMCEVNPYMPGKKKELKDQKYELKDQK